MKRTTYTFHGPDGEAKAMAIGAALLPLRMMGLAVHVGGPELVVEGDEALIVEVERMIESVAGKARPCAPKASGSSGEA